MTVPFADMPPLIQLILYPWLAIALAVYAFRLVRWISRRGQSDEIGDAGGSPIAPAAAAPTTAASPTAPMTSAGTPAAKPASSSTSRWPTTPKKKAKASPAPAVADAGSTGSGKMVEDLIRQEIAERKAKEAAAAEPEDTTSPASPDPLDDAVRVPIADALVGIAMPCDLTPVMHDMADPTAAFDAAFITDGVPAATVASAVAAELERLGFTLTEDESDDFTFEADRAATHVRVVVHPTPTKVHNDGEPRYPRATARSVVVEFST